VKKAVYWLLVAGLLVLLCSCSSGGGNDNPDENLGPLTVVLFAASPDHGFASVDSPLRVTLTWNITGGKGPYYYALDWNGDGQPDWYLNKVFNKTYSVVHDFYPIGTTPYQAVLKVTDTDAAVVTSNPVTITVNTTQTFAVDPLATYVDNDNNPDNARPATDFVFEAGTPVFFRTGVVNGAQPFEYQWDFNEDGAIDSTVATPQYTFSYNGLGVTTMKTRVIVVDAGGEKAIYDFLIPIKGKDVVIPPSSSFEIILSTDPADSGTDTGTGYKLVNVLFQPGSTNPAVPDVPKLGLSVVVNPDPNKAGVPPYEYYWDFQNDGAYDSQDTSPTIPYYDDVRKILVNPYTLGPNELQKSFILRCLVIDSSGKRQDEYRVINVRKLTSTPGEFQATPSYGVVGGDYDGKPYADIVDTDPATPDFQYPETQVAFRLNNISGSSGSYQYKLDIDNDGTPEKDWTTVPGSSVVELVSFGNGTTWPAVGYYPVRMYLRAVQVPVTTPPAVLDDLVFDMPVSLVERPATDQISGSIKARKGHNVNALFDNTHRDLMIIGGSQGTTPLRDVESLQQVVDSDPDSADPITASVHAVLNFERTNALLFGSQSDGYGVSWVLGGSNLVGGASSIINSIEGKATLEIPFNDQPWQIGGSYKLGSGTVTGMPAVPAPPASFTPAPPAGCYFVTPDGQSANYSNPAPPIIEDSVADFTSYYAMSSKMMICNTNRASANYGKTATMLGVPVAGIIPAPPAPAPDYQIVTTQLSISANILTTGDTYEIYYNGGIVNEMTPAADLGYMPLEHAIGQAAYIEDGVSKLGLTKAGYVIVGGMHPPGGDVDEVSGRIISFDPARQHPFIAMDGGNRNMITERYDGAAAYIMLNLVGKLYVIGGRVASGQSVATVEAFNFDTAQWEIAPSLNDARSGHVAYIIDDGNRKLIYVAGGAYYPPGGGQRQVVTTAEVFNPETGVWSYTLPLAVPTENGAASVVPSKETLGFVGESAVWYFGGANANGAETSTLQELVYWIP
jgi:hypothetical protein